MSQPPKTEKPAGTQSLTREAPSTIDEPDEWDQRIEKTGCSDENMKLSDCYFEKKDWRQCTAEMAAFKECWKTHGNDSRTAASTANTRQ